ncbi:hypothetical protein FHT19_003918 [Novosphingobium sp. SG919]|nr:hypothetical protein [Novosphingobium sp. SG919]
MKSGKVSKPNRQSSSLEVIVNRFAAELNPSDLLRAIEKLDSADAYRVPALILRSGIVQTMRDDVRSRKRDIALAELAIGLRDRHGDEVGAAAKNAGRLVTTIERGYLALSDELDAMLADAPPEEWLWAILERAAELVDWSLGEIDRRAAATPIIDGSVFALPDGDGGDYRADELIAMVDATTSMCVRTLAARHGWYDGDGAIVLPRRPNPMSPHVNADKLTKLGEMWEMWRRMETSARFLGCVLHENEDSGQTVRSMTPTREAMSWRMIAQIAHEQLSLEIGSVFDQLIHTENAHLDAVGIDGSASLMPAAYVSATEVCAYNALEMLLAVEPREDTSQYLGLTLVEWIRGYSIIERLAMVAGRTGGGASRLLVHFDEADLIGRLVKLGLSAEKAKRFVSNITFGRASGDAVDDPIVRIADGQLLLMGPLAVNSDVARVILSKFARRRIQIDAKGKRFERRFREHLTDWGLAPVFGTVTDGPETYEIDAAIRLDRRVFLFECKTRTTCGVDPASVWRLGEWMSQTAAQARRIADGMRRRPDALADLLSQNCNGFEVIPCVVSAMPLQAAGQVDGTYFTDQMALAMFFAVGEVGVYSRHRIPGLPPIRQTVFANKLWSGRSPTSEDLLRFLDKPPSVSLIGSHMREVEVAEKIPNLGEFRTVELEVLPADASRSVEALGGDGSNMRATTLNASDFLERFAEKFKS